MKIKEIFKNICRNLIILYNVIYCYEKFFEFATFTFQKLKFNIFIFGAGTIGRL